MAGETAKLEVLPWNGAKAAVSLTFDDGDPSHLDLALPELGKRGLRGTFFLIANRIERQEEWRRLPSLGHEIGNHSLDHRQSAELNAPQEESQVLGAQKVLQKSFGVPILTFAYPFTQVTPGLRKHTEAGHFIARGGYGASYYLQPGSNPDWMNIPSPATMSDYPLSKYKDWIDEDLRAGGWMVLMIHGLEGTPWGWQPVKRKTFEGILDYLKSRKGLWVAPFGEVGAYWRAQKTLEAAQPENSGIETKWAWDLPSNFPAGVMLKVRPAGAGRWAARQGEVVLKADKNGVFDVSFNAKEVIFCPAP